MPLALFTMSRQLYCGYKVDLLQGVSERKARGWLVTVRNPQLAGVQHTHLSCYSSRALFTHTHADSVTFNASLPTFWVCPAGLTLYEFPENSFGT